MKVNQTKAIVACLGIAAAAAIAGSVSGTVAWFQYNTRVTAEFTGTSASCSEFLEVRAKYATIAVAQRADDLASLTNGTSAGQIAITNDGKVYTWSGTAWGNEAAPGSALYKHGDDVLKYNAGWAAAAEYGNWGPSVANADILKAAGRADNGLKPVTLPGVAKNAALGTFYGQPVCGYEKYASGTYHWDTANAEDYMGFQLQFRVLDVDGDSTAVDPAMLQKDLYLTNITVANVEVGKQDISSALRVHVSDGSSHYALLAPGSTAEVSTTTHGALDLGGADGNDTLRDVPNNYSFNTAATELDYGSDVGMGTQVAYGMGLLNNGLYPTNDGVGHLSGGVSFGQTNANVSANVVADNAYLTLDFTIFLEGWQQLGTPNASSLWDSDSYVGAQFNIGMSFGVDTIDERL